MPGALLLEKCLRPSRQIYTPLDKFQSRLETCHPKISCHHLCWHSHVMHAQKPSGDCASFVCMRRHKYHTFLCNLKSEMWCCVVHSARMVLGLIWLLFKPKKCMAQAPHSSVPPKYCGTCEQQT